MRITIKLVGYLAHPSQAGSLRAGTVFLSKGATLADVLEKVGAGQNTPLLVTVNGELAKRDQPLSDGDTVHLIPPINGG